MTQLPPPRTGLRRLMPRSLLGRSLLIILLPLVLLQAVVWQIFYRSHLDILSRRLSMAIAGEIGGIVELLERFPGDADRAWIIKGAWDRSDLKVSVQPPATLQPDRRRFLLRVEQRSLNTALRERVGRPFHVSWGNDPDPVVVEVQLTDQILRVEVPRKRLFTLPIYLFVVFLVGTAVLLGGIAVLFMHRQVRGIKRLAAAAEAFGRGRDTPPIRPEGAIEVRQAAAAFNEMQARVQRFLHQRTEMLAGVSHDLRTPLTRIRLSLEMLPTNAETAADIADITADLEEMDRMIAGYLDFVRGVGRESAELTDLVPVLQWVVTQARRAGATIDLVAPDSLELNLRPEAMRRAITNLVDNARRHAKHVRLSAIHAADGSTQILIEDDGPGIPPERREDVFRPFETGAHGGTGLGLTIVRDIVRAHGGEVTLGDSLLGGLAARITLPAS